MALVLQHRVSIADARGHLLEVKTTIRSDEPLTTLTLFMPVWTPGSYLVREFARHVEEMTCVPASATIAKIRKNAWRISCERGERLFAVRYRIYANELSVRTNHVDESHAFLNGAPTFLAVEGQLDAQATVTIEAPQEWTIATALPRTGARTFTAPDFDTLVDSPIEMGTHREQGFEALGVPHLIAAWPREGIEPRDLERFAADARLIVEAEARFFGGTLPYRSYLCILHVSPRGRGGLEHASAATLLTSPASFTSRDGYLDLLSLFAHEALHTWNVKRIRPAAFTPYRYEHESYTRLLWWFEGATSYYDWRVLRAAKLCTVGEYLEHLAGEIAYLDGTPGRMVLSLEDASFDAWIKAYRPDENSTNSGVSYYRKGEVAMAMLDLEIRARSGDRASLDTALAYLWSEYGSRDVPVPEGAMQAILERATGVSLADRFDAWIRKAGEIDAGPSLAHVGLRLERSPRSERVRASLGARLRGEGTRVFLAGVVRGGAAQRAGLDAGDELIAIGGKRVDSTSLESMLQGRRAGETVEATLVRDGVMIARALTLDEPRAEKVKIVADPQASPEARARFAAWLGETHPSWSAS